MHHETKAFEDIRLAALRDLQILDTPREAAFERLTSLATRHFHVPISIISMVDERRIWFKSAQGLEVNQIERMPGLCASAILAEELYEVRDAASDPRTIANPLVTGPLGLRFYAAVPLATHDGYRVGTFNIIDFKPRSLNETERQDLTNFAALAMEQLNLRLSARNMIECYQRLIDEMPARGSIGEMLRVCAWSKKVFIEGKWITFDDFLVNRLGLRVSHSISPEAEARLLSGANPPTN